MIQSLQCEFERIDDEHIHCKRKGCGRIVKTNRLDLQARCLSTEKPSVSGDRKYKTEPLGIVAKGVNYAKAIVRWKMAGSPVRSDEEVVRIFEDLCWKCEHFTTNSTCPLCGCRVSKSTNALLNKIRMATESCPLKKWGEKS